VGILHVDKPHIEGNSNIAIFVHVPYSYTGDRLPQIGHSNLLPFTMKKYGFIALINGFIGFEALYGVAGMVALFGGGNVLTLVFYLHFYTFLSYKENSGVRDFRQSKSCRCTYA